MKEYSTLFRTRPSAQDTSFMEGLTLYSGSWWHILNLADWLQMSLHRKSLCRRVKFCVWCIFVNDNMDLLTHWESRFVMLCSLFMRECVSACVLVYVKVNRNRHIGYIDMLVEKIFLAVLQTFGILLSLAETCFWNHMVFYNYVHVGLIFTAKLVLLNLEFLFYLENNLFSSSLFILFKGHEVYFLCSTACSNPECCNEKTTKTCNVHQNY